MVSHHYNSSSPSRTLTEARSTFFSMREQENTYHFFEIVSFAAMELRAVIWNSVWFYCVYVYSSVIKPLKFTDRTRKRNFVPSRWIFWIMLKLSLISSFSQTSEPTFNSGDGCTRLWMQLMPLNCILKMIRMENYIYYYINIYKLYIYIII